MVFLSTQSHKIVNCYTSMIEIALKRKEKIKILSNSSFKLSLKTVVLKLSLRATCYHYSLAAIEIGWKK